MSTFKIYGTTFHVDRKYQPIRPLGRGAYGVVWYVCIQRHAHPQRGAWWAVCLGAQPSTRSPQCIADVVRVCSSAKNKANKTKVAIKRILPMSANEVVAKQALREIRLIRHLGRHSNVCGVQKRLRTAGC